METNIDRIFREHKNLKEFLTGHKEISLEASTDEIYRKTLLLAISSYFEDRITNCVLQNPWKTYYFRVSKNKSR